MEYPFCRRTGYEITQSNGQRICSLQTSLNILVPAKGSEIFIGRLPKDLYEFDLIPVFQKIGTLYNFRVMLDFVGKTRGYAFATYLKTEDANRAVELLNNYEIRPNVYIAVYKSIDNRRLFIGNIPPEKTREEILDMLESYCEGLVDVIVYSNPKDSRLNKGFVFAEFENHRLAVMARRQLTPHNLIAWGRVLHVDWAEPVPEVDPQVMAKVRRLILFHQLFEPFTMVSI